MSAYETLREGNVDEALKLLQQEVRTKPADSKLRTFLFQVLAVQGQWERAQTQLSVVGDMDAGTLAMVQTYREAIRCEMLRSEIFSGKRTPLIFGEPSQWVALMTEALRLTADGKYEQAQDLRDQAFEAAPTSQGSLKLRPASGDEKAEGESESFNWIADADPRLGPICEAIIEGRYYWVPFQHVKRIDFDPPADLRDVVWMPAHFVWTNGGDTVALIPTRYPRSHESPDSLIRLARKTEWKEVASGVHLGWGQRMLATDSGEFALMDIQQILLGE